MRIWINEKQKDNKNKKIGIKRFYIRFKLTKMRIKLSKKKYKNE